MRAGAARAMIVAAFALAACGPSPTPTPATPRSPTAAPTRLPSPSATATITLAPTPSPEPSLALELPAESDARVVAVTVETDVAAGGSGELLVTVTSQADARIDELVLRWPAELGDSFFLAPFVPSEERIREGGPPLVQAWTKWVFGPGERGEPAGTVSLGYGPLLPGATLAMPISVTRRQDGPAGFDLQVLAGNAILQLPDGTPAELRVELP